MEKYKLLYKVIRASNVAEGVISFENDVTTAMNDQAMALLGTPFGLQLAEGLIVVFQGAIHNTGLDDLLQELRRPNPVFADIGGVFPKAMHIKPEDFDLGEEDA